MRTGRLDGAPSLFTFLRPRSPLDDPRTARPNRQHHREFQHLVRQALPGLPLRHVPIPPSSIPIKLNYQYFSINQTGPAWEAVLRARNFAAYVPSEFHAPQLELIVILP